MVGTPAKVVARSRSMTSSTLSASKRGTRVIIARQMKVMFMIELSPKMWKSGNTARATPSGLASTSSMPVRAAATRFACVSSAPLGRPVVPDV